MTQVQDKLAPATRAQIEAFFRQRRFAAVGVSRNPEDFSRKMMREFEGRGYQVVPVNPAASELDGRPCFARVQDIVPAVQAVLILTPFAISEQIVRECVSAGVLHVWVHGVHGGETVGPEAAALCRERGVSLITRECPFMFLSNTGFPHRVHGLIRKIFGSYPR